MANFQAEMEWLGVKPIHKEDEYQRWRGCEKKRRYETIHNAEWHRKWMDNFMELHSYFCEHCFGYHVGHK